LKDKNLKILSIIPARGGSKGFPGKNIYPILGKPLIVYTIEASLASKFITKTVVSSDDETTLEIAKSYGAEIIKRPIELALDTSSSEEVVRHTIELLEKGEEYFDIIILLQPTSPLRFEKDIDEALDLMLSNGAEAVTSVTNIGKKPFKSYYKTKKGFLKGIYNDKAPNMRRQDLPDAFMANGAIYAVYTKLFLKINSFLLKKTIPYIMSEEKSIDVDGIQDVLVAENIMKKEN
jgi:CMP-N-acetylneuraminic acid synthetase